MESVNGKPYSVVELKTALFPVSPGRLTIGPAALECRVQDFMSGDPFSSFFEDFFSSNRPVTLRSDPLAISILPLPESGRPLHFKGDVGRYEITAALDKSEAQVHEPVTLTVTVSGEGNIKSISGPALPPLSGFKTYETLSSLNISKADYRVQGSKVFKTVLKPDVSGRLEVPPISFSYFDPRAKSYKTTSTSALALKVLPGSGGEPPAAASFPGAATEGVKVIGQDIRFIKSGGRLAPWKKEITRTPAFAALHLLPGLGFLSLWGFQRYRRRLSADPRGLSFRRALRKADKGLRPVPSLLAKDRFPEAYDSMHRVFLAFLGDKIGAPAQALTWDQVKNELDRRSFPAGIKDVVKGLWEDFDRVRFAPSLLTKAEAEKHQDDLRSVLKELEEQWKK
jgi:hypothetical protein